MYGFQAGGIRLNICALPVLGEGFRVGFAIELYVLPYTLPSDFSLCRLCVH